MASGTSVRGTVAAVAALGLAYAALAPAEALAVSLVGVRGRDGGDLDWIPALASAAVIAAGLGAASVILHHFRPDPAAKLAAWAASAGLARVSGLEGELPPGAAVTRLLRKGRVRCLAAFEADASKGRIQVRVLAARGPRSWFPLGRSDDAPPRVVTQVAVTGLGALARFTIEPQDWLSKKDKRKRPATVSTESVEFGARWLLTGESARDIHACLTPAVMALLLRDDAEGLVYEFFPGTLLTAVGEVLDVDHQLERRLAILLHLVERVPHYLTAPPRA